MGKVKPKEEAKPLATVPTGSYSVPAYMAGDSTGIEEMERFIVPPRLKIVQKQSSEELLAAFSIGTVILSPQRVLVVEPGTPFTFTPIFAWPEWYSANPIETKGQLPFIRERTLDPTSRLAKKCANPDFWVETVEENGKKLEIRNIEALNFLVKIHDVESVGSTDVVMSFSRGEHKTGTSFLGLIKTRRGAMYGLRFQAVIDPNNTRSNASGAWRGFDITNAPEHPFVSEEEYPAYKLLHEEYKAKRQSIRVDYDEVDADAAGEVVPAGEF